MKILVATGQTQGLRIGDYNFCIEGELVWIQEPCTRDRDNPDGPCGCGRGFAGAASHRATSTAMVVESPLTHAELVDAFDLSLGDGGWPQQWAQDVADDALALAAQWPVGTVLERRLDCFYERLQYPNAA